ncbi:hypothetical protein LEL_05131 [Akanthomyces lecanii RCEF 1005]|uniref:Uncharacterized protein n=1 Tax=Akanthomyces lecanii RCEF 1005 TaxID=1081108 RepID=A0A162KQB9_CORDF|nr:hypothetical protein LEL_05131 [Akanthomyces lecanii RCEF 1005]
MSVSTFENGEIGFCSLAMRQQPQSSFYQLEPVLMRNAPWSARKMTSALYFRTGGRVGTQILISKFLIHAEKTLKVEKSEFRHGVLAVRFSRTGSLAPGPPFQSRAERLCEAMVNHKNAARIARITKRGVLGISPRSKEFEIILLQSLCKISCDQSDRFFDETYGEPVSQLPPWSCKQNLKLIKNPSETKAWKLSWAPPMEIFSASFARFLNARKSFKVMVLSVFFGQENISRQSIRRWRHRIDNRSYLALNAAAKILLSNGAILAKFMESYQQGGGINSHSLVGTIAAAMSAGSIGSTTVPLAQFTFSHFTGLLTTLVWPTTVAVTSPVTLIAGLGIGVASLIGHLQARVAKEAALRLKQDLVFISKILFLGQQVDLLQSWENTAVGEEVRRKHLRKMNCPETVTMWTEFIRQARAGDLEPRLPAHRLSNLALDSGGKKARKRDVRLYLSYLLVAGTEEVGSDTEAEGQSSSDSE